MCNNDVVQVDGQPNYVARFGIAFAKQAWISGRVFKSHPINEMRSQSFLPGGMGERSIGSGNVLLDINSVHSFVMELHCICCGAPRPPRRFGRFSLEAVKL